MGTERIIGVDFGTSTSVVRVKRYNGNEPVDERLFAKPVVFNMGSTIVPTLIRKTGTDTLYGYNAEISKKDSVLYQSFKVQLESTNPEQKSLARSLTADYLKYLGKVYREQSEGGHLGEVKDTERTIISYPVKWSQDTKDFMIESAKSAGFPNVTGMDEASAAIIASTLQNEKTLKSRGYLKPGIPLNVLLLDMGAGTTDLVLCKYTPGVQNEILCTYPKDGVILFGGQEIDALLGQYIAEKVPNEFRSTILKKIGQEKYKAWKESVVSHTLQNAEAVKEFGTLDELAELLGFDVDFDLDRTEFESLLNVYLRGLPELVCGCLKEAGMTGCEIDLVILTGGHSQWYFVKDILAGANKEYGDCNLTKIEADRDRIVSISLPQETVALGLAFSGLDLSIIEDEKANSKKADSTNSGNDKNDSEEYDSDNNFLMPIEDVFTISGRGTVVTGKIERGVVRVGDAVEIIGLSFEKCTTIIDGIEALHNLQNSAKKGDCVGLLLRGIGRNEVERGQVICRPNSVQSFNSFICHIDRTSDFVEKYMYSPGDKLEFWFRTIDISSVKIEEASGTDNYLVKLVTSVPMEKNLRFAVRKNGQTISTGFVIEPLSISGESTTFDPYENDLNALNSCLEKLNKELCHTKYENLYNRNELPIEKVNEFLLSFPDLKLEDILFYNERLPWVLSKKFLYFDGHKKIPISRLRFVVRKDPLMFFSKPVYIWIKNDYTNELLASSYTKEQKMSMSMLDVQNELRTLQKRLIDQEVK